MKRIRITTTCASKEINLTSLCVLCVSVLNREAIAGDRSAS